MKLSDQEQVILKAIGSGVAEISRVIRSVGYPKATVKKVLLGLSEKGVVSLHRHDWPQSLKPEQRKLMVRIGRDYFNAVSMRKRNAGARKLTLPVEWQVRPTSWGGARWQHRQEAGDDVYDRTFPNVSDLEWYLADRYGWKFARKVLATLKTSTGDPLGQRNPKSKGKTALKKTGRALKGFTRGALSAGAQILGAGAEALNPVRRKVRNKYIDLVIKGQAKKTPQGWKVGKKTFAQGRGTVNVSSGYYLDKHTGMVYAKRERNKTKKRKRNVSEGFYDASGTFHPIRSSSDYSPAVAGETGRKAKRTRSKKKLASKRKASATARRKRVVAGRKRTTSRLAGRAIKKSSGLLKKGRKRNNPTPSVLAIVNPKSRAAQNRKEFAGEYRKDIALRYPEGTPKGLSKLGKLLMIKTDRATITPINNQTWLVRDLKGKLHIGTTSKDGLIWSGPAENFGKVKRIEYEDVKKHLGYDKPQGFYHFMGEEDGIRPTLYADGKGGLKFKGGNYSITPEGIVN